MVNLVKNILKWSQNQADIKLFTTMRKQLTDPKNDKNQLRQTDCDKMIAPIHAAALSNSPELFKLVLETKGVDPDIVGLFQGKPFGGVLEFAVEGGNLDIISMVLDKIKIKEFGEDTVVVFNFKLKEFVEDTEAVVKVPLCLRAAVQIDRYDIVELLLKYSDVYPELTTSACLVAAMMLNKKTTFSHFLVKTLECINDPLGHNKFTLLHLAVTYDRVEMLRELLEAGCDANTKDIYGHTPFMLAVLGGSVKCGDGCKDQIITELLSSESIDLDVKVKKGTEDVRALELLTEETCSHVTSLVVQAYARKEQNCDQTAVSSEKEGDIKSDGENLDSDRKVKICWSCNVENVSLLKCRGCMKARYCGDKCQEEDWPRHGDWCEIRRSKREKQRKAMKEEPNIEMSEVD